MNSELMKAAVYTQYGPPDIVQIKNIPIPIPGDNQVLIKVFATTVNRTDCGFRSAEYFIVRFFSGLVRPKNRTLGNEFAGEVVSTGKEAHLFRQGDRVFGYNDVQFGAHAEYMVMSENGPIASIPKHLSYEVAAPMVEGSHYALCDLRAAKLCAGQDILINGATGAIGSAAVQLSKYMGARVVAVTDTKNIDLVKSLGADQVIDYTQEDFTKIDQTFDVVFDAVGKSSYGRCKPLLRKKGLYMSTELGYMSQNIFLALLTPLFGGRKLIFPLPSIDKKDVEFLKELSGQNTFKPVIDRVYSLDQIVEAYTYVETGQKIGNVIIKVTPY